MSKIDVLADLQARIDAAGSHKKFADKVGFSQSYITDVINKKRPPSERLLSALGYARQIVRVK